MAFFDERGVAYSYESTVPAPILPFSDQSNNLPHSNKAPPMVDARSGECPRTAYCHGLTSFYAYRLAMGMRDLAQERCP